MKNQKTINFIIYQSLTYIFSFYYILNNYLIKYFPKYSFMIPVMLCIILLPFLILLPKYNLSRFKNSFLLKFIKSTYYLLSNIVYITIGVYTITHYFYGNIGFNLLTVLFVLIILLISLFKNKQIYNITTTIFIIVFALNFLILLNTSFGDLKLLYDLDFKNIFNKDVVYIIGILFLFLDPIIFYFNNSIESNINIKKSIIISLLISSSLTSLIIFVNYLFYSHAYLQTLIFPAFSSLSVYLGPEFIDHFTILILINVFVFIILKCSFNVTLIVSDIHNSNLTNIIACLIMLITSFVMFKIFNNYYQIIFYIGIISTLLLIILFIFIILNKEVRTNASTEVKK